MSGQRGVKGRVRLNFRAQMARSLALEHRRNRGGAERSTGLANMGTLSELGDGIDEGLEIFDGGARSDAVAEVEDVAGGAAH